MHSLLFFHKIVEIERFALQAVILVPNFKMAARTGKGLILTILRKIGSLNSLFDQLTKASFLSESG